MNDTKIVQKWGEGAKTSRKGRFYSFQTVTEGGACLKRRKHSDLCGGRQGLCPLTPRTFEKVRSKLSRFYQKNLFNFAAGES
jgi:hypothetical protein